MQAFGNIPDFIAPIVPGESLIRPIPEELLTPAESATQAAQMFSTIRLLDSAKIGTLFPILELRPLNPGIAAVAAGGGGPAILAVAPEVGPLPISYANMLLPSGIYQLISANAITISLICVLDLYGLANHPLRCSYLPVGVDVLPYHLTLPSTYASLLFSISSEGMRWFDLAVDYNPLFNGINQTNIPYYVVPPILAVPIPGLAGASIPHPTAGLVTAANSNPSFPVGSAIWNASTEKQTAVFSNARAMYTLNNCDKNHVRQQCGFLDPCSDAAIVNLKLKVPFENRSCAFYLNNTNFKNHVLQNFVPIVEETSPNTQKYTGSHISAYLPRASVTSDLPRILNVTMLSEALSTWRDVTVLTHTPGTDSDIQFFMGLIASLLRALSSTLVGGIAKENIDSLVYFVSGLMTEYGAIFRKEEYLNTNVTLPIQQIFPTLASALFTFDNTRNLAEAALMNRTTSQIPLQYPTNKSPHVIKQETETASNAAALLAASNKRPLSEAIVPTVGTPGANLARNQAKRQKVKEAKAAKLVSNPPAPIVRQPSKGNNNGKKEYCCNDFADQIQESTAFPTGLPTNLVRTCQSGNACTRKHFTVDLNAGTLDKGIAASLIKGATTFGNAPYKENFFRIVKFLSK